MQTGVRLDMIRALRVVLAVGAVLYIAVYLGVAALRLAYPYELEWREGAAVDHVQRIVAGEGLYVGPSLDFTPLPNPPLYYYVSAAGAWLFGPSFVLLRLVSFTSSLICLGLIGYIVRTETKSAYAALLAASLFAAMYRLTTGWLDIADVDSLMLALVLAALAVLHKGRGWGSHLLAGGLLTLAFFARQTAILACLPLLVYAVMTDRRSGVVLVGAFCLLAGAGVLIMQHLTDGWFAYYVFQVPLGFKPDVTVVGGFWRDDILASLAPAVFLAVAFLALTPLRRSFWLASTLGMVGASYVSRVFALGWGNDLLPAYALLAILFGLGVHCLLNMAAELDGRRKQGVELLVYLICLVQFAHLFYNPLLLIPRQTDVQAGKQFVNLLAQTEGRVYVPFHAYLPELAGKESHAHAMAIQSILRSHAPGSTALQSEINDAIRQKRYTLIVTDRANWFLPELEQYYERTGSVFRDADTFMPHTGFKTRPECIYAPKP